eukprot:TRINITY_DN9616_c0_g3_i2.p1 TRINITY_DN9616_c0_g3~~TRINITY_DN9616_c0_g3_i2.p1  ORF type:complete len:1152 (+),score=166.18 TRINITY_DN9616_c0_g3_i2:43-3498(+)
MMDVKKGSYAQTMNSSGRRPHPAAKEAAALMNTAGMSSWRQDPNGALLSQQTILKASSSSRPHSSIASARRSRQRPKSEYKSQPRQRTSSRPRPASAFVRSSRPSGSGRPPLEPSINVDTSLANDRDQTGDDLAALDAFEAQHGIDTPESDDGEDHSYQNLIENLRHHSARLAQPPSRPTSSRTVTLDQDHHPRPRSHARPQSLPVRHRAPDASVIQRQSLQRPKSHRAHPRHRTPASNQSSLNDSDLMMGAEDMVYSAQDGQYRIAQAHSQSSDVLPAPPEPIETTIRHEHFQQRVVKDQQLHSEMNQQEIVEDQGCYSHPQDQPIDGSMDAADTSSPPAFTTEDAFTDLRRPPSRQDEGSTVTHQAKAYASAAHSVQKPEASKPRADTKRLDARKTRKLKSKPKLARKAAEKPKYSSTATESSIKQRQVPSGAPPSQAVRSSSRCSDAESKLTYNSSEDENIFPMPSEEVDFQRSMPRKRLASPMPSRSLSHTPSDVGSVNQALMEQLASTVQQTIKSQRNGTAPRPPKHRVPKAPDRVSVELNTSAVPHGHRASVSPRPERAGGRPESRGGDDVTRATSRNDDGRAYRGDDMSTTSLTLEEQPYTDVKTEHAHPEVVPSLMEPSEQALARLQQELEASSDGDCLSTASPEGQQRSSLQHAAIARYLASREETRQSRPDTISPCTQPEQTKSTRTAPTGESQTLVSSSWQNQLPTRSRPDTAQKPSALEDAQPKVSSRQFAGPAAIPVVASSDLPPAVCAMRQRLHAAVDAVFQAQAAEEATWATRQRVILREVIQALSQTVSTATEDVANDADEDRDSLGVPRTADRGELGQQTSSRRDHPVMVRQAAVSPRPGSSRPPSGLRRPAQPYEQPQPRQQDAEHEQPSVVEQPDHSLPAKSRPTSGRSYRQNGSATASSLPTQPASPHQRDQRSEHVATPNTGFVVSFNATNSLPHQQQSAALERRRQRLLEAQQKREALRATRRQQQTQSARKVSEAPRPRSGQKLHATKRESNSTVTTTAAGAKLRDNRNICQNAVKAPTCLGNGAINKDKRTKALKALDNSDMVHYVIALRDPNNLKFRSIYGMSPEDTSRLVKVYGAGPKHILANMVAGYFRYDSGAKEFKSIPSQDMTVCDAVALKSSVWGSIRKF